MLRIGDRVRIIRQNFGHPDLACLTGAEGTILEMHPPHIWEGERKAMTEAEIGYEVGLAEPLGPRGYTAHVPLFERDLEVIEQAVDQQQPTFIVRVYDGFDNQWTDCSQPCSLLEAIEQRNRETKNGTERTHYGDIDYFGIFPADTEMYYAGGRGEHIRNFTRKETDDA